MIKKTRKKLGSILNIEDHERRSYDDSQKVVKNAKKSREKQKIETKIHKSEEVVKYMSYLPNYLERGENPEEKPFNIGVLDWSLLEKWQHSFVASECNGSSHHQHRINRPSLPSHLNAPQAQSSPLTKSRNCETFNAKQVPSCTIIDRERNKEFKSHYANEGGGTKESRVVQSCSKEIRRTNCPSDKDQTVQIQSSASISTSKQKNLEENKSVSKSVADNEAFKVKTGVSETTKARKPSPTRRLSPLRRLLDPLLKPKSGDPHQIARNPSMAKTLKPSVKVQLDLKGCRTNDITESHRNVPSTKQALLQIAVKNGLPLFTFTVDNCNDILAATVKEVNCMKTEHKWIYTFFSFSEMKKKNAHWINQGSKDKNHGYISNVVAHMKVSDIPYCNSNRQREFVLSSFSNDSFLCDELAAIVVKFANGKGNEFASDDEFIVTVILPGGDHAAPSKGEPSTLIRRWKSGGSCDCGGWDLGCRIRLLDNINQTKSLNEPQFKLFSQDEVGERKAVFVLSPFEDGIFSVEFSSSLELIQAFSFAIAVVNSKTDMLSPNMSQGMMSSQNSVCAKAVSYPPVSPVGRV